MEGLSTLLSSNPDLNEWNIFFQDAGLPKAVSSTYASSFVQHRIIPDMLAELNTRHLQFMGINVCGDIIAILRHVKKVTVQDSSQPKEAVQVSEKLSVKSEREESPEVVVVRASKRKLPRTEENGEKQRKRQSSPVEVRPTSKVRCVVMPKDQDEPQQIEPKPKKKSVFSRLGEETRKQESASTCQVTITDNFPNELSNRFKTKPTKSKTVFSRLGAKETSMESPSYGDSDEDISDALKRGVYETAEVDEGDEVIETYDVDEEELVSEEYKPVVHRIPPKQTVLSKRLCSNVSNPLQYHGILKTTPPPTTKTVTKVATMRADEEERQVKRVLGLSREGDSPKRKLVRPPSKPLVGSTQGILARSYKPPITATVKDRLGKNNSTANNTLQTKNNVKYRLQTQVSITATGKKPTFSRSNVYKDKNDLAYQRKQNSKTVSSIAKRVQDNSNFGYKRKQNIVSSIGKRVHFSGVSNGVRSRTGNPKSSTRTNVFNRLGFQ